MSGSGTGTVAAAATTNIQRLTGTQIETAVLQAMGYTTSAVAPWGSSANFILRANDYVQRLPQRATVLARKMSMCGASQTLRFDMWKSTATSSTSGATYVVVASGSSTIYFPTDFDSIISLYDATNKRDVPPVKGADKYFTERLKNRAPGPPEALEILGFTTGDSSWRRAATLYPATLTGTTPSLTLVYWRIPAKMSDGNAYPDIDPKYEQLVIAGTIAELSRKEDLSSKHHATLENEMLIDLIGNAEVV